MKKRLFAASAGIIAVILVFGLVSFLLTPYAKTYSAEHVSQSKKQIALTFDDGPGKHTQQLLDGLRERNIKASFFLMGSKVEKRPEIVKTARISLSRAYRVSIHDFCVRHTAITQVPCSIRSTVLPFYGLPRRATGCISTRSISTAGFSTMRATEI